MINTEREKINILSLYDITVSDRGGMSYEIIYKGDKLFYNKTNFRNLDTFSVVNCIIRTYKLKNDILLKEKFLIENKISKYWLNSHFIFVKGNIKIPYSYKLYREQYYEEFVKSIDDIYGKNLKEKKYADDYSEIDNIIISHQTKVKETDNFKTKKENIKRILIEKKMLV